MLLVYSVLILKLLKITSSIFIIEISLILIFCASQISLYIPRDPRISQQNSDISSRHFAPCFISSPQGRLFVSLETTAKADFYINTENNGVFHGLSLCLCFSQSLSNSICLFQFDSGGFSLFFFFFFLFVCDSTVVLNPTLYCSCSFPKAHYLALCPKGSKGIFRSQITEKLNSDTIKELIDFIPSPQFSQCHQFLFSGALFTYSGKAWVV